MSAVLPGPSSNVAFAPLMLAVVGFVAMYLPSYLAAAHGLWQTDESGHAPVILIVVLWLFWLVRKEVQIAPYQPLHSLGWPLLVLGILLYGLGRVFAVSSVEFVSQPLPDRLRPATGLPPAHADSASR